VLPRQRGDGRVKPALLHRRHCIDRGATGQHPPDRDGIETATTTGSRDALGVVHRQTRFGGVHLVDVVRDGHRDGLLRPRFQGVADLLLRRGAIQATHRNAGHPGISGQPVAGNQVADQVERDSGQHHQAEHHPEGPAGSPPGASGPVLRLSAAIL
jgi:hypothetical protein